MRFLVLVVAVGMQCAAAGADYLRDVRPILAEKCFVCHGPARQMGGLHLDKKAPRQTVLVGGIKSEFVRRILSKDVSVQMPPWPSALSTSPQEIEVLKSWAATGA